MLDKKKILYQITKNKRFNINVSEPFNNQLLDFLSDFSKELKKEKKNYKYPDIIYITSLEKLVYETNKEKENIMSFLNLDMNNLNHQDEKKINYIKKINDDSLTVTRSSELFLNYRFYGFKYINKNFNLFTFAAFIIFNLKFSIIRMFK